MNDLESSLPHMTLALLAAGLICLVAAALMWLSDDKKYGPHIRHTVRVLLNAPWAIPTVVTWAVGSLIAYQRHGEAYHGRHRVEDLVTA